MNINLFLDTSIIYLTCGAALIMFLHYSNLFFLTAINPDEDDEPPEGGSLAIKSLMFCINTGIFATAVLVWPLVLIVCLDIQVSREDD